MKFIIVIIICLTHFSLSAQRIIYSPAEDKTRQTDFAILGKVENNYLVLKTQKRKNYISVYDGKMQEVKKTPLSFLPEDAENIHIISYPSHLWMIYQFQKGDSIYCNAIKINSNGQASDQPITLDKTEPPLSPAYRFYHIANSEDKNRIMVIKIRNNDDRLILSTKLFDGNIKLLHKSSISTVYKEKTYVFSEFILTNRGKLAFAAGKKEKDERFITELFVNAKLAMDDEFCVKQLNIDQKYIDNLKITADNLNERIIINSFLYPNKQRAPTGFLTAILHETDLNTTYNLFSDGGNVSSEEISARGSNDVNLNNLFVRDIILKKDGSFLLTAERFSIKPRLTVADNIQIAQDILMVIAAQPPISTYGLGGPWEGQAAKVKPWSSNVYSYDDILILSVNNEGKLKWIRKIEKSQRYPGADAMLSYIHLIANGELLFLFNRASEVISFLDVRTVDNDGIVGENTAFFNLARGHTMAPRLGKQVTEHEIIIPWIERKKLGFAKIEL